MNKPRVGVDCDGVLGDLLTSCLSVASEMLGREISMDHVHTHDIFEELLPEDRIAEFWAKIGEPGLCRNIIPYPGAVDGMRQLAEVADVYCVTSYLRGAPQWVYERDLWVSEHFGIPRKKMIHTPAKYTFYGKMLIDDKPQNIDEWAREHETGVPVLWLQPYNLMHVSPSNHRYRVVHTNSWDKVVDIATSL